MTLPEAKEYALRLGEPVSIMWDPEKKQYHVIRAFGVEHWKQHYTLIMSLTWKPEWTSHP